MTEQPVRQPTSSSNNAGFTLVEVVVAMGLILVSLMGLLQMAGLATAANMKNQLRDEAVLIGEDRMADLIRQPQSTVPAFERTTTASQTRGTGLKYTVTRQYQVPPPSTTSHLFTVKVEWNYKGAPYSHEVQAVRSYTDGR